MREEIVIITGSSSGIGFGLAKYYLSKGYKVIGMARRDNSNLSIYENYIHFKIDITNINSVKEVFTEIKKQFNSIKLLILNAGILGEIKNFNEIDIKTAKEVMNVNVWANKYIIDEIIQQKIRCKQIIGISSGAARNGNAGWGAYSISKAALNIMLQTYAKEQSDIHFTAVAPGLVDTAMQDYLYTIKSTDKHPSLKTLHLAKETHAMPKPEILAPLLAELFDKALNNISGGFIDIRD